MNLRPIHSQYDARPYNSETFWTFRLDKIFVNYDILINIDNSHEYSDKWEIRDYL